MSFSGWWRFSNVFLFSPLLGEDFPFWDGLKPTTSFGDFAYFQGQCLAVRFRGPGFLVNHEFCQGFRARERRPTRPGSHPVVLANFEGFHPWDSRCIYVYISKMVKNVSLVLVMKNSIAGWKGRSPTCFSCFFFAVVCSNQMSCSIQSDPAEESATYQSSSMKFIMNLVFHPDSSPQVFGDLSSMFARTAKVYGRPWDASFTRPPCLGRCEAHHGVMALPSPSRWGAPSLRGFNRGDFQQMHCVDAENQWVSHWVVNTCPFWCRVTLFFSMFVQLFFVIVKIGDAVTRCLLRCLFRLRMPASFMPASPCEYENWEPNQCCPTRKVKVCHQESWKYQLLRLISSCGDCDPILEVARSCVWVLFVAFYWAWRTRS